MQLTPGEADYSRPYIDVRTTDPQPLRAKGIPEQLDGYPVRIRPGTLDEQIAHVVATREMAEADRAIAWREGLPSAAVEANIRV